MFIELPNGHTVNADHIADIYQHNGEVYVELVSGKTVYHEQMQGDFKTSELAAIEVVKLLTEAIRQGFLVIKVAL